MVVVKQEYEDGFPMKNHNDRHRHNDDGQSHLQHQPLKQEDCPTTLMLRNSTSGIEDESDLMPVPDAHAAKYRFPPGCPVVVAGNCNDNDNDDTRIDHHNAVVEQIMIHFASSSSSSSSSSQTRQDLYQVRLVQNNAMLLVTEHDLQFPVSSPVFLETHHTPAVVVGAHYYPADMEHDMPATVLYLVKLLLEGNDASSTSSSAAKVYHGVSPQQLLYRRVKDPPTTMKLQEVNVASVNLVFPKREASPNMENRSTCPSSSSASAAIRPDSIVSYTNTPARPTQHYQQEKQTKENGKATVKATGKTTYRVDLDNVSIPRKKKNKTTPSVMASTTTTTTTTTTTSALGGATATGTKTANAMIPKSILRSSNHTATRRQSLPPANNKSASKELSVIQRWTSSSKRPQRG